MRSSAWLKGLFAVVAVLVLVLASAPHRPAGHDARSLTDGNTLALIAVGIPAAPAATLTRATDTDLTAGGAARRLDRVPAFLCLALAVALAVVRRQWALAVVRNGGRGLAATMAAVRLRAPPLAHA